jgi:hypothetical protein
MNTPGDRPLGWQGVLAAALLAEEPLAALASAADDAALSPGVRRAVRAALVRPTGFAVTALLVAKLRFERLIRGSSDAEAWFDRAPDEFTAAFRRYHSEVKPTAPYTQEEAAAFEAWLTYHSRRGVRHGGG